MHLTYAGKRLVTGPQVQLYFAVQPVLVPLLFLLRSVVAAVKTLKDVADVSHTLALAAQPRYKASCRNSQLRLPGSWRLTTMLAGSL